MNAVITDTIIPVAERQRVRVKGLPGTTVRLVHMAGGTSTVVQMDDGRLVYPDARDIVPDPFGIPPRLRLVVDRDRVVLPPRGLLPHFGPRPGGAA